jgi:hypothetical protein
VTEILTLIEEGGVDRARGLVDKALAIQHGPHGGLLVQAQCPWMAAADGQPTAGGRPSLAVDGTARHAEHATGGGHADDRGKLLHASDHDSSSVAAADANPSSVATFF